ncbi:MAG: hypothetical protein B7C24_01025 [Bacteroidetes bacterium 4572_77]|nr:MAG: hypothetical protein B7C24_01025 [Bacteroidetes bacterium 4572_77]
MKNLVTIILLLIFASQNSLYAQESMDLKTCFEMAQKNSPLYAQKQLQNEYSNLSNENFKKDLLPQIALQAKATWQNEVISLPISIPNMDIPELSQDQYRLSVDVNQAIYRGGIYQKQKEMESLDLVLEQLQIDKNLYDIKKEVKDLFFAILLLDKQKKVVLSYGEQLDAKIKELTAYMEEGALIPSAIDGLKAEKLSVKQRLNEMKIHRDALLKNLEYLTLMDLQNVKELTVAPPDISFAEPQRLEYALMTASQKKMAYAKKLLDVQKLPQVYAFASGGYGRPAYNYLSDNFDDFYMVGLQLKWNIINWNSFSNEKKKLDVNIRIVESQKEEFNQKLQMLLQKIEANINSQQALLNDDDEMIHLRKNVADNASHQLNQGVITSAVYIGELQKYNQSEINKEIHKIQLINSQLDYLNVLGKL